MKKSFVAIILILLVAAFFVLRQPKNIALQSATEKPIIVQAINGLMMEPSQVRRPFAVVIENHPDARPQSGLSQADIVYEALAEGGITRFLAIFQTQNVSAIGPVRSARTYFNDWAEELGAIYAHVGGNSDALAYIKKGIPGVSDADQFFNDPYFKRTATRPMPHNTYTSTTRLLALAQKHNYSLEKNYVDYLFKDDAPVSTSQPPVAQIKINFSEPEYLAFWQYDSASNSYKRYLAGAPATDLGNNKNIYAKTVIVQRVANWPVKTDTPFAISMATRDGGLAEIYQDGNVIKGTWREVQGRTKFFDAKNKEIVLNRGQIWIEIVPPEQVVLDLTGQSNVKK